MQKNKKTNTNSLKINYKDLIRNNNLILKTKQRFKSESYNVLMKKLIRSL